ncbi:hypothetical protein MTR_0606s0020 [Medicago truncatula]|uniref:Uncharacterized protein n=1 Tax=Medicago truncatula TaxID=3880 RepID=A0A072TFE8_MEDTR|nr:hypothetical protein MTR_0606s0020 [Medicago truncatula]
MKVLKWRFKCLRKKIQFMDLDEFKIITEVLEDRLSEVACNVAYVQQMGSSKSFGGNVAVKIDIKKALDFGDLSHMIECLEKKCVWIASIQAIHDMHEWISTSVRTHGGDTDDFPITIGLHQDDIVLLGKSKDKLNERLKTWRQALEIYDFHLSRSCVM